MQVYKFAFSSTVRRAVEGGISRRVEPLNHSNYFFWPGELRTRLSQLEKQ